MKDVKTTDADRETVAKIRAALEARLKSLEGDDGACVADLDEITDVATKLAGAGKILDERDLVRELHDYKYKVPVGAPGK